MIKNSLVKKNIVARLEANLALLLRADIASDSRPKRPPLLRRTRGRGTSVRPRALRRFFHRNFGIFSLLRPSCGGKLGCTPHARFRPTLSGCRPRGGKNSQSSSQKAPASGQDQSRRHSCDQRQHQSFQQYDAGMDKNRQRQEAEQSSRRRSSGQGRPTFDLCPVHDRSPARRAPISDA